MSSILTNNSAMVALQTLKSINKGLEMTQSQISTGKRVADASDNSAVWAISKTMESDVKGFKAISDSLALGESTVATARNAAETVTDLLVDMKGRIVAAQEENVDRASIQRDIDALEDQITSVVSAAQFNGLNLIDGSSTDSMNVLSSLDRDANGNVTARNITVDRQNLSVTSSNSTATFGVTDAADQAAGNAIMSATAGNTVFDDTAFAPDLGTPTGVTTTVANNASTEITIGEVSEGHSYQIILDDVDVNVVGGGSTQGQRTFEYVATADDGTADVARELQSQISAFFGAATDSGQDAYSAEIGVGANGDNVITLTNGNGSATSSTINVGLRVQTGGTPGSTAITGGLGAVAGIDVTSNATGALTAIEGLITQATNAAAAFGSDEGRIQTQTEFVSKLSDSLKTGIGSMVDANMEEASARLQALQTQQQLGVQALSIANQAPQSILQLFR